MIIVGEYCGFYIIPISDLDTYLSYSVIHEEVGEDGKNYMHEQGLTFYIN